jgi:hypothetical protein
MKKQIFLIVCALFSWAAFSSCRWHYDSSISVWDNEDEYELNAIYAKSKTGKVQRFLDRCLEERCNTSFSHSHIDKDIILDDRTKFYIHSYPGELEIKINKTENSDESLVKIKELCEDLKDILEHH